MTTAGPQNNQNSISGSSSTGLTQVAVAIPAYNEEKQIARVVTQCVATGAAVWVVDDGSKDQTAGRARSAGARIITHAVNRGKGSAIRTALTTFAESTCEYLVFMDADGQHEPKFIASFVEHARATKADLVVGNRMLSTARMPPVRRITNQFMSWVVSRLSRQNTPDSQCGYRLVSREFACKFHPTTFHFDLESEMIIQAGRLKLKIESVPISTIYEGQTSHINPLFDTLRFVKLVIQYL